MKKPYMHTIMGSSGRYCILIISFQLHGSKTRPLKSHLFWVGQYDPQPSYLTKTNPILILIDAILKQPI